MHTTICRSLGFRLPNLITSRIAEGLGRDLDSTRNFDILQLLDLPLQRVVDGGQCVHARVDFAACQGPSSYFVHDYNEDA